MGEMDFIIITGSRSEWFILEPLVKKMKDDFKIRVMVVGSHLSRSSGETFRFVEDSVEKSLIIKTPTYLDNDDLIGRAKTVALEVLTFTEVLNIYKPRGIIVLGDREETIAASVAANYLNIPVIHLGGGDKVVGNVDDTVRHAVTKLAHLHFPFTKYAYKRIIQMGEEEWRVTLSGSPSLDGIKSIPVMPKEEVLRSLGIENSKRIVTVIYHPISSEYKSAKEYFSDFLKALKMVKDPNVMFIIIQPNMDPGSSDIVKMSQEISEENPDKFRFFSTLPRKLFINLLRNSELLVGNSSLGIHEAAFLKLPVVNVLPRQRERDHPDNVVFVEPNFDDIKNTVERILRDDEFREKLRSVESIYGDGNAVERIISKLKQFSWDSDDTLKLLLNKRFIDRWNK